MNGITKILTVVMVTALLSGLVSLAMAADTGAKALKEQYVQPEAKHWHEIDTEWMKKFHNPMDGVTMGLDIRLRQVYAENLFMEEDIWRWGRYRARWGTKWQLDENVTFNTRLVWEFRDWNEPDQKAPNTDKDQHVDFDEILFDHLNVQIRNAFDLPLTLTLGRQDIIFGTGWLVLDGNPADGSRTIFFDAIRGTYDLSDTTKLDLVFIKNYDGETEYLKPFNHRETARHLTQKQDETGLILYLTNKCDGQQREAYYIYKKDEPSNWSRINTYSSIGTDQETHTFGGRLAGKLDDNWSYTTEAAIQCGRYDKNKRHEGLGTNNRLTYAFNDEQKNEIWFMYEYLSGDDPTTETNEKFNTLWGDWPQPGRGGDLQSYIWTKESGFVGEVANMHRFGVGHSFKPAPEWTMLTQYNLMCADENTFENDSPQGSAPNSTAFSTGGDLRGQMLTGLLTYQCCKNFRTQFLVDYFMPGSYYDGTNQDAAMFARVNVEWTF